ncbi:acetylxylan esterase [Streptomyces thinghirensis]|nr:acetylxylan esterase [Streptomyces thinghirensis]
MAFAGFADHPVKNWLILPAAAENRLPLVVEFVPEYGGGRGLPPSTCCGRPPAGRT